MPKAKEDKIQIRQFRDSSSNWWVNDSHFYLNTSEELIWGAGGQETVELREAIESFINRNKKKFIARAPSVLEQEEKVYKEVFTFGKFSGKKVDEVVNLDRKYLQWCLKNVNFAGKEKLKEEIADILK